MGELWAGQTKLKEVPKLVLNEPRVSELVENLGADVPTGSKITFETLCQIIA